MQSEEQRLIDGLFERLKQTETNSAARDSEAEQRIIQHLREQPGAPYYMAQTILIQEAAIKQLNSRIQALESEVAQLTQKAQQQKSSGGFLAGLFGGNTSQTERPSNPIPGSQNYASGAPQAPAGYAAPAVQQPAAAPRSGGGFMAGALQTAAGVAGGVLVADMLTSMFHHNQPEEIVNIINEPENNWQDAPDINDDNGQFSNASFFDQRDDSRLDNGGFYGNNDNDDYGDDFGDDDNNFI